MRKLILILLLTTIGCSESTVDPVTRAPETFVPCEIFYQVSLDDVTQPRQPRYLVIERGDHPYWNRVISSYNNFIDAREECYQLNVALGGCPDKG